MVDAKMCDVSGEYFLAEDAVKIDFVPCRDIDGELVPIDIHPKLARKLEKVLCPGTVKKRLASKKKVLAAKKKGVKAKKAAQKRGQSKKKKSVEPLAKPAKKPIHEEIAELRMEEAAQALPEVVDMP